MTSPHTTAFLARTAVAAWATLVIGAMTWALFAGTGAFAMRDMVVVDHPFLTYASLGLGSLPGRNVPQDAVLAIAGLVLPATWVVRVLMVGAAAAGAFGAARLSSLIDAPPSPVRSAARTRSAASAAAAITIAVANPFVVERLLQGHWSLVIAAWLLPLVAWLGFTRRTGWLIVAVWACSLTPTGALAAVATALATHRRWQVWVAAVSVCAPWAVTGLLQPGTGTSSRAAVEVFAPRAEEHVGTIGALLGLGGIWNAEAVPASREHGFALAGVALFAVLLVAFRRIPRPLVLLAAAGFAVALTAWFAPGVLGWVVETIPGAGLLRDSQKWLILAIPAYVAAAGALPRLLAIAAIVLTVLQTPDTPTELGVLRPIAVELPRGVAEEAGTGFVLFVDRPTLIERADGIPVVDPATKAMNVIETGSLSVDGQIIDPPANLPAGSPIRPNLIVYPDGTVEHTGAPAPPTPWLGLILLGVWAATPLLALPARARGSGASRSRPARSQPVGKDTGR
ncbi:hypothetical protein [Corynebacterium cystitidis]|uniref:hypothetical protein n=1 Tax=Corynebacterium cystitidis TaxID=35757 RepID=UPI00211F2697|nr:hypothetical protein [Corynebacterium cystitidis]